MKVLLTGYGPFGAHKTNVSSTVMRALDGETFPISNSDPDTVASVEFQELPVEYEAVTSWTQELWCGDSRPDLVIHCGVASKGYFKLETRARGGGSHSGKPSLLHLYKRKDNKGETPASITADQRSVADHWKQLDGPKDLQSTVPIHSIIREAQREELVSAKNKDEKSGTVGTEPLGPLAQLEPGYDAGLYLCEFVLYRSLSLCEATGIQTPVVFLHVPPAGEPFDKESLKYAVRKLVRIIIRQVFCPMKERLQTMLADLEFILGERDKYLEKKGMENASKRPVYIQQLVDGFLFDYHRESLVGEEMKADKTYQLLLGRALCMKEPLDPRAVPILQKAIKRDPKNYEIWNELGEAQWKMGDLEGASFCFKSANNLYENKISLRALSMILRSGEKPDMEASLAKAKEALKLDLRDGRSWYCLGNAHLFKAFANIGSTQQECLLQAHKAYSNCLKDRSEALNNQDLHFHLGLLYRYEEMYADASKAFGLASVMEPSWSSPNQQMSEILNFCKRMSQLVEGKCRVKGKRLDLMCKAIAEADDYMVSSGSKELDLKAALEATGHHHVKLKVLQHVTSEKMPQAYVVIDKNGTSAALTVYNLASNGSSAIKANSVIVVEGARIRIVRFTPG
eukprot:UC4_evm2s182